jgi:hypothetical protein
MFAAGRTALICTYQQQTKHEQASLQELTGWLSCKEEKTGAWYEKRNTQPG